MSSHATLFDLLQRAAAGMPADPAADKSDVAALEPWLRLRMVFTGAELAKTVDDWSTPLGIVRRHFARVVFVFANIAHVLSVLFPATHRTLGFQELHR